MALVVEDGTGLSNSNTYLSLADLDAYALLRAIDLSSYSIADKEAALVVTCLDFFPSYYCFAGDQLLPLTQAMQLPTDDVGIEPAIEQATAMGAILHLQGKLIVDVDAQGSQGVVKSESTKVDVIETEVEFFEGTAETYKVKTPMIDNILNPWLAVGTGNGIAGSRRG